MAIRGFGASSTGESSSTSTSYATKTTYTFTPDDNTSYVYIATFLAQPSITTVYELVRLRNSTSGTTLSELRLRNKASTDYMSRAIIWGETFGTSPGSQTIDLDYASGTGGTAVRIKEAYITVIKLGANDSFTVDATREIVATTTETTVTTLTTGTPPATGKYAILTAAAFDTEATSSAPRIYVDIGGTNARVFIHDMNAAYTAGSGEVDAYASVYVTGDVSTAQTIDLQAASNGATNDTGIAYKCIVALWLDDFEYWINDADDARTTDSSESFITKSTVTFTAEAVDHIIMAGNFRDSSVTGTSVLGRMQVAGATIGGESLEQPNTSGSGNQMMHMTCYLASLSAGSTTVTSQFSTPVSTTNTAGCEDSFVLVIQVEAVAGATVGPGPQGPGNEFVAFPDGTIDPTLHKISNGISANDNERIREAA